MPSFWNRFLGNTHKKYAFVDVETGLQDRKIHDIGALLHNGDVFHENSKKKLFEFLKPVDYLCGHNIVHHDASFLFTDETCKWRLIDTLYLSPLLFPDRPYHKLLKDDKLISEQINNPVNDCEKTKHLFLDETDRWHALPQNKQLVFATLLANRKEFAGFLHFVGAKGAGLQDVPKLIREHYAEKICSNAPLEYLIGEYSCELAYALALIDTTDHRSVTPGWVLRNFPKVEYVMVLLREKRCQEGCPYCNKTLDVHQNLKTFFGYDNFRTYGGEPLQEQAVKTAVDGESLLAIFPTGGGKSLTFQLPALMAGHALHGLTVVISPLQSLMKDQVDNLAERGITDAVTINGLLDPISRALSIQRVQDGEASLLYISPEMLRSKTIERILMSRHVVRFVIDEAHCFSAWGQDFRVDYLYIGQFIKKLQESKKSKSPIPVSCFTATAKQKVVQDICDYFKQTIGTDLKLLASSASRTNLHYSVIHSETDEDKYLKLRELISSADCPTIVYVSRTKRTRELAEKLSRDGFHALPYNGKMDADKKIANQDSFMNDQTRIIVATSAFGMGVDKKDVGLVIHFDISDSLENYIQEAGRAGRDPNMNARCFVLYCDSDLDKHFVLLNQTKLSISEIQQVWSAVKKLTKQRMRTSCSALEIARQAGWDDSVNDIETRVRTALAALEQSGYLIRGNNVPHVYATGITVKNMEEARKRITASALFDNNDTEKAIRIIKSLISQKYSAQSMDAEAESRIDYLADVLGLTKSEVISVVERMRQEGILADSKDIAAYLPETGGTERRSKMMLERFCKLEQHILNQIPDGTLHSSYKKLNSDAVNQGMEFSKEKDIRTLIYFLTVKGYMKKEEDTEHNMCIRTLMDQNTMTQRFDKRIGICRFTVEWLHKQLAEDANTIQKEQGRSIRFSVVELLNEIRSKGTSLWGNLNDCSLEEVEEALLYLSKIDAIQLEGGFLVLYNAMDIKRIKDNKSRYKLEDYRMLNEFYKQKIQQVHIVGEYANLMVRNYQAALQYVQDYFQMDYKRFVNKYFKGERVREIERNITPQKYQQIFGQLSARQMEIISDKDSRCIVVAAGPGSGKTRVLVHKLASLLLLEDVKHEQLLMLTFSRTAATEFKQRLIELIGNAAHFVEIKTFHSYCFDLLGRIGNLDSSANVVAQAAELIDKGEVEPNKISKSVLVIDEAQDMSCNEYDLICALMKHNEEMRIIAVGDDDQNIYAFRGSDSRYMYQLTQSADSRFMEMTENYRSTQHIVTFANDFVSRIRQRMKTIPILAMNQHEGWVETVYHTTKYMYEPLVNQIAGQRTTSTIGVLTQTNEEAVMLTALLKKRGIQSKLIQGMDGFRFCNLAEVRFFTKFLSKRIVSPIITDEVWQEAKKATYSIYSNSSSLSYLQRCITLFEETNRTKYFTDFKEYAFESSVEDFCEVEGAEVVVSTIHKAKGREFDDVYLLINGVCHADDELLRRLYVGVTRAKMRLFIHTNTDLFSHEKTDVYQVDACHYSIPQEIMLQLGHRDVNLGFFKKYKQEILKMRSGDSLRYQDGIFYNGNNCAVARVSASMQLSLNEWEKRGFQVTWATVRFIVAWKPKDAAKEETETAVLLPDVILKR